MSLAIVISYYFLSSLEEILQFSMIQCLGHNWLSDVCLNNNLPRWLMLALGQNIMKLKSDRHSEITSMLLGM